MQLGATSSYDSLSLRSPLLIPTLGRRLVAYVLHVDSPRHRKCGFFLLPDLSCFRTVYNVYFPIGACKLKF